VAGTKGIRVIIVGGSVTRGYEDEYSDIEIPIFWAFAGVALIKTFTVCLSWGFGELYHRIYGVIQGSYEMFVIPGVLTTLGLLFFILYIGSLKIKNK